MAEDKEFERIYEQYKAGALSLDSVDGSTLLKINRTLDEELSEMEFIVGELEKILYGCSFVDTSKRPHFP